MNAAALLTVTNNFSKNSGFGDFNANVSDSASFLLNRALLLVPVISGCMESTAEEPLTCKILK